MDYIRFGHTSLKVSQLCLGTMSMGSSAWKGWVLDEDASRFPSCGTRSSLGINFFDMADWYSLGRNEEVVGRNLLRMAHARAAGAGHQGLLPDERRPEDRGLSRGHIA